MLVRQWMTRDLITVTPETTIRQIYEIFDKYSIRRVPVVSGANLLGIVSHKDIRRIIFPELSGERPELEQKLSAVQAGDVMTRDLITIEQLAPIEEAALLMHRHKIGGLPVMEEQRLIGIITEHDVFEALLEVTGAKWGVPRLTLVIDDRPGSVKEVADIIRKHPAKILSFLITKYQMPPEKRELILRVDSEDLTEIIAELRKRFGSLIVHE